MRTSGLAYSISSLYGQIASSIQINAKSSSSVAAYQFNFVLSSILKSNESLLLGRLGSTESRIIRASETGLGIDSLALARHAKNQAGIAPRDELKAVADVYLREILNFNFLAEWPSPGHTVVVNHLKANQRTPFFYNLEFLNPLSLTLSFGLPVCDLWLSALAGQRVLIVHPCEESFRASTTRSLGKYESELLPELDYKCVVPPVTFGSYKKPFSYLSQLQDLRDTIIKLSRHERFDTALVAAGGYGLPIASFIYKEQIAKKVLHVGGALQIYFGVVGNRWLSEPYKTMYRSYDNLSRWSRIIDPSITRLADSVEKGCYL
jgi:hypothetical protein